MNSNCSDKRSFLNWLDGVMGGVELMGIFSWFSLTQFERDAAVRTGLQERIPLFSLRNRFAVRRG
jgi:hypothetical protein